ncbi:MAG: efflux RND transporter periplasmic adaptor subunit [Tannerellaceae bacterium]|jgi:membrane fusion protein (multidrug efflux system)|nr:efflux RND transporter periplasmic adaptor subunit [Tannerellaceae bacterium]
MAKRMRWGIVAIIALLVLGIIAYPQIKTMLTASKNASGDVPPSRPSPRTQILNINAEVIHLQPLTDTYVATGSTIPDEEVDLSFESSGKIVAIYFTEGTHVKEGDLLAKINDKPLQAQLKKLEAQVPLARDRVYRQHTLLEKDAVSQEAYEQVTTEYEKLMADIELVKANIAQTELRAPFDGIIGLRSVSEGAYATPSTVIVKLTKISPIKIEFSFPEKYVSEIKDGTSIVFRMESSTGIMQDYRAKVYALESKIEPTTRTLKARAIYPNLNEVIQPGRTLSIVLSKREVNALAVPSEAVIPEMGKNIVYLYKSGVAKPTEIIIGLRTESRVEVLEGIHPGDTVITTGVMQMRTGMKVTIDNLY